MLSVVIPAHNEGRVLGRLLTGLLRSARPGEFEIVVVANGCTDETAAIAASHGARVLVSPVPSKREALRLGDTAATGFPRLYVDADVELGTADARALAEALGDGVLAVAPARRIALRDRPWSVRAYYAVWTRLPHVEAGLFGRGVIAVGEEGNDRIRALPPVMADDLAASNAFAPGERRVVPDARVVIQPPRSIADLLRRRVRAIVSVHELDQAGTAGERTGPRDLLAVVAARPWLGPAALLFLGVALLARRRAARAIDAGDYTTWLRDESSRS